MATVMLIMVFLYARVFHSSLQLVFLVTCLLFAEMSASHLIFLSSSLGPWPLRVHICGSPTNILHLHLVLMPRHYTRSWRLSGDLRWHNSSDHYLHPLCYYLNCYAIGHHSNLLCL